MYVCTYILRYIHTSIMNLNIRIMYFYLTTYKYRVYIHTFGEMRQYPSQKKSRRSVIELVIGKTSVYMYVQCGYVTSSIHWKMYHMHVLSYSPLPPCPPSPASKSPTAH